MKKPFSIPMPLSRWRRGTLTLLAGACLGLAACVPGNAAAQTLADTSPSPSKKPPIKIRLIVGEQIATATLYDNATARDFAALLVAQAAAAGRRTRATSAKPPTQRRPSRRNS